MDNKKEYILCAALLRKNSKNSQSYYNNDIDKIEIGYRHHDIRNRFKGEVEVTPSAQGFYTSKGRFVDRYEAMRIAYECGQVSEDKAISGKTYDGEIKFKQLFSEDLY